MEACHASLEFLPLILGHQSECEIEGRSERKAMSAYLPVMLDSRGIGSRMKERRCSVSRFQQVGLCSDFTVTRLTGVATA